MDTKETMAALRKLSKEDRPLAMQLLNKFKSNRKIEQQNLTGKEKLIKGMSVADRVSYVMANPKMYRELAKKGIITKSVMLQLKQKGFRPNL